MPGMNGIDLAIAIEGIHPGNYTFDGQGGELRS